MSTETDGGPAFPKAHDPYPNTQGTTKNSAATGMRLRDWFAGQAEVPDGFSIGMAEAFAGREHPAPGGWTADRELEVQRFWAEAYAGYRYMTADAMLTVRAKAVRS